MRVDILGVGLDLVDARQARSWLEEALTDPETHCAQVVTLNPEYVMLARRDAEFRATIAAADLITADGVGVLVGARLLHGDLAKRVDRVTGLDLCDWLAGACAAGHAPLFLLGGRNGAAEGAARRMASRWPDLTIAGHWEGGISGDTEDAESPRRIATGGARALLVAYGAPGQVLWIERNRAELARNGVRVAIGVGGAFDYLSGQVPRAPAVVRRLGLEWLYRLVKQPWRWRRQLVLPRFAGLVIVEALKRRLRYG